jgi:MerR family transcriptional regulator, light-induced transcriptional regulator
MATYSIKDLEKISGIKAHTIRIWEKRYGLVKPNRTATNIRYYSDFELRKLLNISILARNGLKISKISNLGDDEISEKVLLFTQKSNYTENTIENLILSMIEMDENKFNRLLSNQIIKLGFEETFSKVLQPFFERIGILWQAGTIISAQEHFISNLVRQNLLVAIDSHRDEPLIKSSQFLLFLPEEEKHELGLLFYQYSLRKRGFKTIYLGQSVPLHDLERINELHPTEYILTNLTISIPAINFEQMILRLSETFSTKKILISGVQINKYKNALPANVIKISSPTEFIRLIENYN